MAITVPPVDTPKEPEVVPASGNSQQDLSATQGKHYLTMCLAFLFVGSFVFIIENLKQSPRGCNQAIYQDLPGDLPQEPTRCGILVCYSKKHSGFMKPFFVYRLLLQLPSSLPFLF